MIDGAGDSVVARLWGTHYCPKGLVVNYQNNKLYSANSESDDISVFDLANDTLIETIAVGMQPGILAYNHINNKIYCASKSNYYYMSNVILSIIDGTTHQIIRNKEIGRIEDMVYNSLNNRLYCAQGTQMSVIDGITDSVVHIIPFYYSINLAYNSVNNKIYAANNVGASMNMKIVDCTNDSIVDSLEVYADKMIYNEVSNKVYCINHNDNNLIIVDGAGDTVRKVLPIGSYVFDLAYNNINGRVYCERWWEVAVIDGYGDSIITRMEYYDVGGILACNQFENKIYTIKDTNHLWVADGFYNQWYDIIEVGIYPAVLYYNGNNHKLYCVDSGSRDVAIIDGVSDSVVQFVGVGLNPCAITHDPYQNIVYVANRMSSDISVIYNSQYGRETDHQEEMTSISLEVMPIILTGKIRIRFINKGMSPSPNNMRLRIYDIAGRLVRRFQLKDHLTRNGQLIWAGDDQAGSRLSNGVYFIQLSSDVGSITKKIIISR